MYRKGRNKTLEALQKHFVKAINAISKPGPLGYSAHLCVSKGDWKHKKEWLQQSKHYSNVSTAAGQRRGGGHVCPRCLAGGEGRPYVDMAETFHNEEDLAVAAATSTNSINKYGNCSWDSWSPEER